MLIRSMARHSYDMVMPVLGLMQVFNLPVSDEVISAGLKVVLYINVGQIVDDLRRGVGLMRRNIGRLWTCLKGHFTQN